LVAIGGEADVAERVRNVEDDPYRRLAAKLRCMPSDSLMPALHIFVNLGFTAIGLSDAFNPPKRRTTRLVCHGFQCLSIS